MALDISELPAPQRPRQLSFYLVLLGIVLPFWSVSPLSWLFLIYALRSRFFFSSWSGRICLALSLSEVRRPIVASAR
jgi:hypothetical protein